MLRTTVARLAAPIVVPAELQGLTLPVTTPGRAKQVFDGARYALLDCGGTIWQADKPLPKINETIDYLRHELGLQVRFVTNNATASRADTVAKFHGLGMTHVTKEEIFSSAYAAQVTLRRAGSDGKKFDRGNVLVLGNEGLDAELQEALAPGFFTYGKELKNLVEGHDGMNCKGEQLLRQSAPYDIRVITRCWDEPLLPPPAAWSGASSDYKTHKGVSLSQLGIAAVVIGLDFMFSPTALAISAMALQQHRRAGHAKALFIATNTDPQMPTPGGWHLPGCGSLVAALETGAGRKPDVVCGKPTTKLFRLFQESEALRGNGHVCPSECVFVGDRLSTDMAFGNNVGARTVHVTTGCETLDDVPAEGSMSEARRRKCIPQFATNSLPDLIDMHRGFATDSCGVSATAALTAAQRRRQSHMLSQVRAPAPRSMLREAFGASSAAAAFQQAAAL